MNNSKWALVIPTFNRSKIIESVLLDLISKASNIIIVDDASTDDTASRIKCFLHKHSNANFISLPKKRGKGYCLQLGLKEAKRLGCEYAITMDSDGQSNPEEISRFLLAIEDDPYSIFVGSRTSESRRRFSKNVIVHKFSSFWFHLMTDIELNDAQSNYRIYPLNCFNNFKHFTSGYEFELEALVYPAWSGIMIKNIPITINAHAPQNVRTSNFRPIIDSLRILIFNIILIVITFLWVWPCRFFKSFNAKNMKKFFRENISHSPESNEKIALSIAFGIFMGLTPVWGYQMVITGVVAHFARLNKVLSLTSSNLSLPFIVPFVLYGGCAIGAYVLQRPILSISDVSFAYIKTIFGQYLLGSIILAIIISILLGILCYVILSLTRKK